MISKEAAYSKISDLVDRFSEQYESYRSSEYNEALTRKDFIDPFFEALGWDMNNRQGYKIKNLNLLRNQKTISKNIN